MQSENGLMIVIRRLDVWIRRWIWLARRIGPSSTWRRTGTLFFLPSALSKPDEYNSHRNRPDRSSLHYGRKSSSAQKGLGNGSDGRPLIEKRFCCSGRVWCFGSSTASCKETSSSCWPTVSVF